MSQSKFIELQTNKLSDYFEVRANRVLDIDDISSNFSNVDSEQLDFRDIYEINPANNFNRFLVQTRNPFTNKIQATEVLILNDTENIYTLTKNNITSSGTEEVFADIQGRIDDFGGVFLQFLPDISLDEDYEIKILQNTFLTRAGVESSFTIGSTDLLAFNSNIASGMTTTITLDSNDYSGVYYSINLIDTTTEKKFHSEIQLVHDGTNTYLSETTFDDINGRNGDIIGNFEADLDGSNLILTYTNTGPNEISLRSRSIGFGNTSDGEGIYRFLASGQPPEAEKSVIYSSNISSGVDETPIDIITLDKENFTTIKSYVYINSDSGKTIHQLLTVHNNIDIHVSQYGFNTNDNNFSGIGTFGGVYSGSDIIIRFYPDLGNTGPVVVSTLSECFYKNLDRVNIPEDLVYFPNSETVSTAEYFSVVSENYNRTSFPLNSNGTPIFEKTFNPNSAALDFDSGIITINNHFFSDLERLIYTPSSTFEGVSPLPVSIVSTLDIDDNTVTTLPEQVYVIKVNKDQFRLATRPDYASVGIAITFTSVGQGNAHKLEMFNKNAKSLIVVNDLIQYPILYTSISYDLDNNIGIGDTIFSVTGIEDIRLKDLLKIDDEYMFVENVGVGTNIDGPIRFTGNIPLVQVSRGAVGSISTSHNIGTSFNVYRGSYNISENQIHFTEPPGGTAFFSNPFNELNLLRQNDEFYGKVFLRSVYSSNIIADDISSNFTGFGATYTLTSQGNNFIGIGESGGAGIAIINGIFQSPDTENNSDNNFTIIEDVNAGITSISFIGIRTETGDRFISNEDVNQNELPRGGLIISLGSSTGVGYAPLVGASVSTIVSSGTIIGINTNTNFGSWGSGYREPVSVAVTESGHTGTVADIDAVVGAGGSLSFIINNGGTGYSNPQIIVGSPSYDNLEVETISRLGVGVTDQTGIGLLVNVSITPSLSGIGQSYFEASSFSIARNGYGFKRGDLLKPIGLVTAAGLAEPLEEFTLTVTDTFNDNFAYWNFGDLNYIDSIKNLQDGIRVRFPLLYNDELISFEKNPLNSDSQLIDMESLLIIFVNGLLQKPKLNYIFNGGTSFEFIEAPQIDDNVSIFFYTGVNGIDSIIVNSNTIIEKGDRLVLLQSENPDISQIIKQQNERTIVEIANSNTVETSLYTKQGIDFDEYRPIKWIKQKRDLIINNESIPKTRDSLEAQIYPTAKVIKNISPSDTEIFVDSIDLFKYDNDPVEEFSVLLVDNPIEVVSAAATAVVSSGGSISSVVITNPGLGYTGSEIDVKFSSPYFAQSGTGVTAIGILSVNDSQVSLPLILSNPGIGYSQQNPPQVIIASPKAVYEDINAITNITGASVNIIEISNSGNSLEFSLDLSQSFDEPQVGHHVYVSDTTVGSGITSINSSDVDVIGIGTVALDNIYYVHAYDSSVGIVTCNVLSTTNFTGLSASGSISSPVGRLSWGRISSFFRENPISINVNGNVVSGLSTYPTIQRRGFGLRNTGSIKKSL